MRRTPNLHFGKRFAARLGLLHQSDPPGGLVVRGAGPQASQVSGSTEAVFRDREHAGTGVQHSTSVTKEDVVKSFLAGLRYECSKGLSNTQGTAERFAEFAVRRSNDLLSCGAPTTFSQLAAGFLGYEQMSIADRRALVTNAMREAEALQGTPPAARPLPRMLPRLGSASMAVSAAQPTGPSTATEPISASLAEANAQQHTSAESNGAAAARSGAQQPVLTRSSDAATARSDKQVPATVNASSDEQARSAAQQSTHGAAETSTSQRGAAASPSQQSPRVRGASNLEDLVSGDSTNSGADPDLHAPTKASALERLGGRMGAGTASGGQSGQGSVSSTSQLYSGIRFMTPNGDTSAAPLSDADLSATLADSWQPGSPAAFPPQLMPAVRDGLQPAVDEDVSTDNNAAENGNMMHALVGEDEEFSVGTDAVEALETFEGPQETAEGRDACTTTVDQGKRQVKPETAAFRASFTQAAAAHAIANLESAKQLDMSEGEQRTAEWHAERDKRLTASAFGNALGFWPEGRVALWEEKLQLRAAFAGNEATDWGTQREAAALARYQQLTGHLVSACRFSVLRDDVVHGWLGASPDGLIDSLAVTPGAGQQGVLAGGSGPGVLEIKCPFNRGRPTAAAPPKQPPWYYMPQVQGLMEIFDREWCNIYMWTVNGSALFYIPRDRAYWAACFEVLSEYWWAHLVPAKHALAAGKRELAETYRPQPRHRRTQELIDHSKLMAASAPVTKFPAASPRQSISRMAPLHQRQRQ
ncbi:g6910 [Coccomyxa elongata]